MVDCQRIIWLRLTYVYRFGDRHIFGPEIEVFREALSFPGV